MDNLPSGMRMDRKSGKVFIKMVDRTGKVLIGTRMDTKVMK